jgi:hypothetical protein
VKKLLFISLAIVLALSVGLIGCDGGGGGAPTKIVVGLARDFDLPLSCFECGYAGPTYRWYAAHVNEDVGHAGELHLDVYDTGTEETWVPLELLVRDFDLLTFDIAAVTEGLIDDGADFIWGGPGTAMINPQSTVCNSKGVLLFTLEGGASTMIWDGDIDNWPFSWTSLSFANWYQMPILSEIINAQPEITGNATAYVTYIQDAHGYEYLEAFGDEFGDENIVPGGDPPGVGHIYEITTAMANTIIQNAATALNASGHGPDYDIFCAFTYPWNVGALTAACIANDFNPPAIIMGPGANGVGFNAPGPAGFDGMVEGIMCFTMANNKTVVTQGEATMPMAELYDALAVQVEADWADGDLPCDPGTMTSGYQNTDYWGYPCYIASMEMFKYAVEDVGELDTTAIRDALVSYNSTYPAQTVFGNTWYEVFPVAGPPGTVGTGGGILSWKCHTGEIGQWQSDIVETIGYDGINSVMPNYDATEELIYPMTDLWAWLAD